MVRVSNCALMQQRSLRMCGTTLGGEEEQLSCVALRVATGNGAEMIKQSAPPSAYRIRLRVE